jgi:hypothetical protein
MIEKIMNENATPIVPHPRYGDKPRASGCDEAVAAARKQWGGETFREWVFPESAILADPSNQNYTVSPRMYYVDTKKTCRDCGRYFIFFADEQRHWYEDLGFFIDADCVRCPECRKADRTLRRRFERYSQSIKNDDLDDTSLATLVGDAVFLWEHAILKKEETLYRLRKLACSRIPDHQATSKIIVLIDSMHPRGRV